MSDHHDEITTLPSYLEEQDALEQEAAAELPLECTVCTYEFGSIKQEVYQCITCQEETRITNGIEKGGENGICYACHIMCHADHQVQEIGMKRGWTCDCGTEKIASTPCTLNTNTKTSSHKNHYDHGFDNVYCICKGPDIGDMIQCHMCEDWFHFACMMQNGLPEEEDSELLCRGCIAANPWLLSYAQALPVGIGADHKVTEWVRLRPISQSSPTADKVSGNLTASHAIPDESTGNVFSLDAAAELYLQGLGANAPEETATVPCSKPSESWFEHPLSDIYDVLIKSDFWDRLCRCKNCERQYSGPLAFIKERSLDAAYIPPLSAPVPTEADLFNLISSSLSSTEQRNIGYAMNDLRDKMREFLIPYANSAKVVSKEDVKKWSECILKR